MIVANAHRASDGSNLSFIMRIFRQRNKAAFVKGSEIAVNDVNSVKEYSCMQGLVAVDKAHSRRDSVQSRARVVFTLSLPCRLLWAIWSRSARPCRL